MKSIKLEFTWRFFNIFFSNPIMNHVNILIDFDEMRIFLLINFRIFCNSLALSHHSVSPFLTMTLFEGGIGEGSAPDRSDNTRPISPNWEYLSTSPA